MTISKFIAAGLLSTSMLTAPMAFAAAPESDEPIIIVQNNWTSQLVLSTVVGKVLEGMVDAGTHSASTREEWWVPAYVAEKCPGLPDWKALDKCAEIFSTAETAPKGRFVDPPADWGKTMLSA